MLHDTNPKPPYSPNLTPHNRGPKPRVSWNVNAQLMRLLWDGPHTMAELVEETGLSFSTVRGYVLALRKVKLVAVVDLLVAGNGVRCTHVYRWKPDARDFRVVKKTPAQRQQQFRERQAERQRTKMLCFLTPPPAADSEDHDYRR